MQDESDTETIIPQIVVVIVEKWELTFAAEVTLEENYENGA